MLDFAGSATFMNVASIIVTIAASLAAGWLAKHHLTPTSPAGGPQVLPLAATDVAKLVSTIRLPPQSQGVDQEQLRKALHSLFVQLLMSLPLNSDQQANALQGLLDFVEAIFQQPPLTVPTSAAVPSAAGS